MITCKRCGNEIETWADEEETVCSICGGRIKTTGEG
jgi:rRNA maturation endonuclease Nob1